MPSEHDPHRLPKQYWAELQQLKSASIAIRLHRDRWRRRLRALEVLRAVSSSGSIAAWACWKEHALLWGGIIAVAQVADAVKHVIPLSVMHASAAELTHSLDLLFIEAQADWEKIHAGRLSSVKISELCMRLRTRRGEAERKHFPHGVHDDVEIQRLAIEQARRYFAMTYPEHVDGPVR